MFTREQILTLYRPLALVDSADIGNFAEIYVYLEDLDEILDFYERNWDRSSENAVANQQTITALVKVGAVNTQHEFIHKLWDVASSVLDFK